MTGLLRDNTQEMLSFGGGLEEEYNPGDGIQREKLEYNRVGTVI